MILVHRTPVDRPYIAIRVERVGYSTPLAAFALNDLDEVRDLIEGLEYLICDRENPAATKIAP